MVWLGQQLSSGNLDCGQVTRTRENHQVDFRELLGALDSLEQLSVLMGQQHYVPVGALSVQRSIELTLYSIWLLV